MRIILFRGKTKKDNQWVYGSYIAHETSIEWVDGVSEDGATLFGEGAEVKEDTVSEFTGLHDNNGKRIFEGDIVKFTVRYYANGVRVSFIKVVEFNNGKFFPVPNYMCEGYHIVDFEVIGNKWDNPELLKED